MPASPDAAERARSLAERGGCATVLPSSGSDRVAPLLHHVSAGGDAVLLLPDQHPLVDTCLRRGAELPGMLEVTDTAPVPLREPVRGLLWITGWLRRLDLADARAAVLDVAQRRPDPRLLDVGHGTSVLRLRTASLILADGEGTDSVHPDEFHGASPDPFCRVEARWLRHLERCHADVVARLAGQLPARLHPAGARVRPLGLDRFGLRLRLEPPGGGDHNVRLPFGRPVADIRELGQELRRLLDGPSLPLPRR